MYPQFQSSFGIDSKSHTLANTPMWFGITLKFSIVMFLLVITYYSLDEIWRLQTNELTFSLICAITLGLTYLAHEYMRIIVNHSQPNLTTTTLKDTTEKSIEIVLVIELAAAVGGSLFAAYKSNEKKKERDNKKTPILDEINARRQQQLAKQDALNKFIEDKLDKRSEENTISIGKGPFLTVLFLCF